MLRTIAAISAFATGLTGCAGMQSPPDSLNDQVASQTPSQTKNEEDSLQSGNDVERRLEARQRSTKRMPEHVSPDSPTNIMGEVPESVLQAVKKDLASRMEISFSDIIVIMAEALIWNDGSLGCARPGQVYTQALVPGYRIILEHAGKRYDYRASERAYFFLCEMQALLRSPADAQ